jgi:hypothetical protein
MNVAGRPLSSRGISTATGTSGSIEAVLVVAAEVVVAVDVVVGRGAALPDEATEEVVSATVPPHALIATAMTEIATLVLI